MREQGILRGAQTQVVVRRRQPRARGIGRNAGIAGHAERFKSEVGEQGSATADHRPIVVARETVALVRAQVDVVPAQLGRRQRDGLAIAELDEKGVVVLAGVGVKAHILQLVLLQRLADILEGRRRVIEHIVAERLFEERDVTGILHNLDHRGLAGIGHLERRQQRDRHLLRQRVGAAVPGESAAGRVRAHVVRIQRIVRIGGNEILVGQCRHGAKAGGRQIRSAELHRLGVRGSIVIVRVVAARTRHLPGSRQVGIEEQLLAHLRRQAERRGAGLCMGNVTARAPQDADSRGECDAHAN